MIAAYSVMRDILQLVFSDSQVVESDEVSPGFVIDYDELGNPVSMEILDASRRVTNPRAVELRPTA